MRDFNRELRLVEQQASAWAALVRRLRLRGDETTEDLQELKLRISGEDSVSAAFLIERLAVEVGRIRERINYYADCLLEQSSAVRAGRARADALLLRALPDRWIENHDGQHWIWSEQIAGLFHSIFEQARERLSARRGTDFEAALMDRVFLVRRIGALTQTFPLAALAVDFLGQASTFFYTRDGPLAGADVPLQLRGNIRRFLASEHLVPWNSSRSGSAYGREGYVYESLFDFAGLIGDGRMKTDAFATIDERLARQGSSELREEVGRIIGRVSEAVTQYGYEEWRSIVLDGISGGLHSPLGNSKPINIIPAPDAKGSCQDVVLAVSSGLSRKSATGLGSILSQVRVHLLKCRNTKVVIVVADAWDPAVYADSKPDFDQHMANGVLFVRLDVMGARRITPILFD